MLYLCVVLFYLRVMLVLTSFPSLVVGAACSYLGFVDLYGTSFSDTYAASGFGSYMALPIIRDRYAPRSIMHAHHALGSMYGIMTAVPPYTLPFTLVIMY